MQTRLLIAVASAFTVCLRAPGRRRPVPHRAPKVPPCLQPNAPSSQHVQAHSADALALLERAVNINSGTMNLAGVREVGRLFAAELETLGFKTRWVDGSAFKRAGHLVADHPGSGPRVLLIGHLDTVFEPDSPFQKFERLGPTSATRAGRPGHEGRRRHHGAGAARARGRRRAARR